MLRTQIDYNDGPTAMRYPRGNCSGELDLESLDYPPVEIGKGEVLREGREIALLGIGRMTKTLLEAAPLIEKELGHPVTVADARFVKPLDGDLITRLANGHAWFFTAEENSLKGGFGSAVNEFLAETDVPARAHCFGLPDAFVDHGQPGELLRDCGLLPEQIAARVLDRVRSRGDTPAAR